MVLKKNEDKRFFFYSLVYEFVLMHVRPRDICVQQYKHNEYTWLASFSNHLTFFLFVDVSTFLEFTCDTGILTNACDIFAFFHHAVKRCQPGDSSI